MRLFSTLYKVYPTAFNECTEELALERIEEKCIPLENKKKKENEDKEAMSSHAIRALTPIGIVHFSRFITVHVENYFGAARNISFFFPFSEGKKMDPWYCNIFCANGKSSSGIEKSKMNQSGNHLKSI